MIALTGRIVHIQVLEEVLAHVIGQLVKSFHFLLQFLVFLQFLIYLLRIHP